MKTPNTGSAKRIWFGSREIWIIITLLLLVGLNVSGYFLIQARHAPGASAAAFRNVHSELRVGMMSLLGLDLLVFALSIFALSLGCKGNCLQLPSIIPGMERPKPLAKLSHLELGSREIWIALSTVLLVGLNVALYNLFMQKMMSGETFRILGSAMDLHKYAIPILVAEAAVFGLAIARLGIGCSGFCVHVRRHNAQPGATSPR